MSVRRSVRDAGRWVHRAALSKRHVLPDFLVIGAMKSGTTALMDYLMKTPRVFTPKNPAGRYVKELHYFDNNVERGDRWYRTFFPLRSALPDDGCAVGEGTPMYLFHPLVPGRVAARLPEARLIAVLRDPVERAFSHYKQSVKLGHEDLDFVDAIRAEEGRLERDWALLAAGSDPSPAFTHFSYVSRGDYAEQLERWHASCGAARLLVLTSTELLAEPGPTYGRVLDFLGVPPPADPPDLGLVNRSVDRSPMPSAARDLLRERFEEPNRRLRADFGIDLSIEVM